ncbi:hypothetical protein C6558_09175 [Ensifer sp. NM-2]|nr:hypothetical protein C6558_09175 [Ensifer sp. NM-2]
MLARHSYFYGTEQQTEFETTHFTPGLCYFWSFLHDVYLREPAELSSMVNMRRETVDQSQPIDSYRAGLLEINQQLKEVLVGDHGL